MFSEFSDILLYYPLERKGDFISCFIFCCFCLGILSILSIPSRCSKSYPFPRCSKSYPFPRCSKSYPFPRCSEYLRSIEKVETSPKNSKLSDFVVFRVGRGVRGCPCLCLYFYIFLYFVFCILYFVFLDNPSYSLEFFESFEFFDFHTFIFSFCLYISIYSRYFLHTIPWRDILFFLFCLHISNLSTI